MFISFEGIEGSGKSTQMKLLAEHLKARGRDVLCTYEPGGTPIGNAIRKILLDPANEMDSGTELFLIMSSRRQLVEQVIRPALESGRTVLSDRFVDSSFAYQAFGRGLPEEMVSALARWACGEVWPRYTILFDLPAAEGLARSLKTEKAEAKAGQADRIERSGVEFMERVRQGFLELARREPERFIIVPVTGNVQETFSHMISGFLSRSGASESP